MASRDRRPPHPRTGSVGTRERGGDPLTTYRVAAVPVLALMSDDVILSDGRGQAYLWSDGAEPTPLARAEADALGMFFEASQDSSWHTLPELQRMIFGHDLSAPGA